MYHRFSIRSVYKYDSSTVNFIHGSDPYNSLKWLIDNDRLWSPLTPLLPKLFIILGGYCNRIHKCISIWPYPPHTKIKTRREPLRNAECFANKTNWDSVGVCQEKVVNCVCMGSTIATTTTSTSYCFKNKAN